MSIEIKEVQSKSGRKAFVRFPFELYANSPYWVPPMEAQELMTLDPVKNPAFQHSRARLWLAYKKGRVVGRIAAIINLREIELLGKAVGRFGWFDFVDDREVSTALLEKAENWLRKEGMEAIKGPYGFTNFDKTGLLTEGFNELPTLATLYNHSYYINHLIDLGYKTEMEWVEYQIAVPSEIPERIERLADTIQQRLEVRPVTVHNKRELLGRAHEIFDLLVNAYQELHGFIPYTQEQIDYYIKNQIRFIQPEYVSLIADPKGNLVAFGITMPSLSRALQKARGSLLPFGWYHLLKAQKHPREADLLLIAVRPDYRNKGLNALIFRDIMRVFMDKGVKLVETNAELEANQQVQSLWQRYEPRLHKRRRTVVKSLL